LSPAFAKKPLLINRRTSQYLLLTLSINEAEKNKE